MREIKFRAWNGIMHSIWFRIDPEGCEGYILMQYTGMEDKNGVEIYEGDIVTDGDEVRKVWFDDDLDNVDGTYSRCSGWAISWGIDKENIEVIGNIYENPDLLEE